jgi:hypothetical protein
MKRLNKIRILIAVMLVTAISVSGQKETLTFKISKPKSELKLHTADSVFHIKKNNPLFVEVTGKNKVFRVTAINGVVRRKPNNFFEIRFNNPGETVIKVYEKTPKGKPQLGLSQAFKVVGPPKPTVYVCGVKSDSVIDKKHLLKIAKLSAELKTSRIIPAIISYDIIIPIGDTIHVEGAKFPVQLKNKLLEVDEGDVLLFMNINVLMPSREVAVVQELMVFIAKTDQYSIGHRNETIRKEEE